MGEFLEAMWDVLLVLAPWLLLGALVGGLLHVLVPADWMKRQLTGRAGVLKAVALGVPLPLCSCGVIPVGLQLKKSGASDGPVVAFLISTPQTGADSIFVSASLLGWPFAIFKVASAAFTGLVGGWLADAVSRQSSSEHLPTEESKPAPVAEHGWKALVEHSLMLLQSIWGWLLFGVVVSALIETFLPKNAFDSLAAYGGLGAMVVTLAISLPLYVCATASVPIAAALVSGGLPAGAAIVFLMAGPATNIATLGAVYRTLGRRSLTVYLVTIVLLSIAGGWVFGFVVGPQSVAMVHEHESNTWWNTTSALILLSLFVWFAGTDVRRFWSRQSAIGTNEGYPSVEIGVEGMTCRNCVDQLERVLLADEEIDTATVTLQPGRVAIQGRATAERVRQLVEQAGYTPS